MNRSMDILINLSVWLCIPSKVSRWQSYQFIHCLVFYDAVASSLLRRSFANSWIYLVKACDLNPCANDANGILDRFGDDRLSSSWLPLTTQDRSRLIILVDHGRPDFVTNSIIYISGTFNLNQSKKIIWRLYFSMNRCDKLGFSFLVSKQSIFRKLNYFVFIIIMVIVVIVVDVFNVNLRVWFYFNIVDWLLLII